MYKRTLLASKYTKQVVQLHTGLENRTLCFELKCFRTIVILNKKISRKSTLLILQRKRPQSLKWNFFCQQIEPSQKKKLKKWVHTFVFNHLFVQGIYVLHCCFSSCIMIFEKVFPEGKTHKK